MDLRVDAREGRQVRDRHVGRREAFRQGCLRMVVAGLQEVAVLVQDLEQPLIRDALREKHARLGHDLPFLPQQVEIGLLAPPPLPTCASPGP